METNEKLGKILQKLAHKYSVDSLKRFKPQTFWCHACDENQVKSEEPSTGSFFQIAGSPIQFGYGILKDNTSGYESVLFAICSACLEK